jgi:hypothetical protein
MSRDMRVGPKANAFSHPRIRMRRCRLPLRLPRQIQRKDATERDQYTECCQVLTSCNKRGWKRPMSKIDHTQYGLQTFAQTKNTRSTAAMDLRDGPRPLSLVATVREPLDACSFCPLKVWSMKATAIIISALPRMIVQWLDY